MDLDKVTRMRTHRDSNEQKNGSAFPLSVGIRSRDAKESRHYTGVKQISKSILDQPREQSFARRKCKEEKSTQARRSSFYQKQASRVEVGSAFVSKPTGQTVIDLDRRSQIKIASGKRSNFSEQISC